MAKALMRARLWLAALASSVLLAAPAGAELRVHFLDVGQGDAILLETYEGAVMVDAGPGRTQALRHLEARGIERLELIIASHAHADHIAGFIEILAAVPVATVWYNGQTHTTRTFEDFVDAIAKSDAAYHEPVRGETWSLSELTIEVLHPTDSAADYAGHLHDMNIVVRADYGAVSVLLTGDAEHAVELELVGEGLDLEADILKLGHHGSHTSSHPDFVAAVDPELAIYQAAEDNQYGHPHRESVAIFQEAGIALLGTATHGTILVRTDGQGFTVETARDVADGGLDGCVDLNAAPPEELTEIVHIGPSRAADVIDGRPWSSLRDLTRIHGIAAGRLNDIKVQGLACIAE